MNRIKKRKELKKLQFIADMLVIVALFAPVVLWAEAVTREGTSTLTLTLATPDDKPAKEARVIVDGKPFKADREGKIKIPGLTRGWKIVSSEFLHVKRGFLGFGKKTTRFVGFSEIFLEKDKEIQERLTLEEALDVNSLCFSCHPDEATRERRVIKCLHTSGKEVPGKQVGRVGTYNLENEKLAKEKKPHYPPIVLEKRVIEEAGKKIEKFFLTCESCHTMHVKTPYRSFVIAPFETTSDLCRGCHV